MTALKSGYLLISTVILKCVEAKQHLKKKSQKEQAGSTQVFEIAADLGDVLRGQKMN